MRLGGIEMENMFLWSLILIFSVLSFNFNFTLSGVNRAFLGLFKAIPMNNVMAFESYGDRTIPYFDEASLEAASRAYVAESLSPYGVKAELSFKYRTIAPLKGSRHNYVSVTLKSDLGLYGEFTKSLHFSIEASGHE